MILKEIPMNVLAPKCKSAVCMLFTFNGAFFFVTPGYIHLSLPFWIDYNGQLFTKNEIK